MFPTEEFWNDKFGNEKYFYGIQPNEFLKEYSKVFENNSKILSLGEGEGRNGVFLAKQGHNITALDASSEGLKKTLNLANKEGVNINQKYLDVVLGDWDSESWDGIINIYCHLSKENRFKVYEKIHKSLNKSGIFLTEQFSIEQLNYKSGGPPVEDMLLTLEEFETVFKDYKIIYAKKELIELDEGRHKGKGSVIRFIAEKV